MSQDEAYLKQVEDLVGMARRAMEEAETYAGSIVDPEIKEKAAKILEDM